jgi:hypothetical protein
MNHTSFAISTTYLTSHIDKALDLTLEVAIRNVSAVFAPLAREDATFRGAFREWWDRVA